MSLFVLMVCFALQRYLDCNASNYSLALARHYVTQLSQRLPVYSQSSEWIQLSMLLLPPLLLVLLFGYIVHALFATVGSFVFNAILFWYLSDCRNLDKSPLANMSVNSVIAFTLSGVFAVIFWYLILGAFGLVLYGAVLAYMALFSTSTERSGIYTLLTQIQGILEWVPVRLLGLTFALVGNFAAVFPAWFAGLLASPQENINRLCQWGELSMGHNVSAEVEDGGAIAARAHGVIALLNRALIVWLIITLLLVLFAL